MHHLRYFSTLLFFFLCGTLALSAQQLDLNLAGANAASYGTAAQPRLVLFGKQQGITLAATFRPSAEPRAFWDFPISEDLAHCAGVKLRLQCQRSSIVRQFNIYIRTDSTSWYAASFTPTADNQWQEIFIPKAAFKPEQHATSWHQCNMLRIALWQGANGQCAIHLAQIEFVKPNLPIAIIRTGLQGQQLTDAHKYAENISDALVRTGIVPAVIDQLDATFFALRPYQFLFIPILQPDSRQLLQDLAAYITRGGKVAVFHSIPPLIQHPMKLPVGKFMPVRTLPSSLTGIILDRDSAAELPNARSFLQPSTGFIAVTNQPTPPVTVVAHWADSQGKPTHFPAILKVPSGFWMTHVYLNKDIQNGPATLAAMPAVFIKNLRHITAQTLYNRVDREWRDATQTPQSAKIQAKQFLRHAAAAISNRQYTQAFEAIEQAKHAIRIPPPTTMVAPKNNEVRAIWSLADEAPAGMNWPATAKKLADANLNALFILTSSPILCNFPSKTTPFIKNTNHLAECIEQCHSFGIQVHAWLNVLSVTDAARNPAQKVAVARWEEAGRLQKNAQGETLHWLCPSQIINRKYAVKLATDIITSLPFDGIHLDFIRYPETNSCYCNACKKSFEMFLGQPVHHWPKDACEGGILWDKWNSFRQKVITSLLKEISQNVRQFNSKATISVAVFPDLDLAKTTVAQNWQSWCDNHLVDVICPMNYHKSVRSFVADITRQKQQLGPSFKSVLPGIGISTEKLSIEETRIQINEARKAGCSGIVLFKLDLHEVKNVLPFLFR